MKSIPASLLISIVFLGMTGCGRREGETAMTSIGNITTDKAVAELTARYGAGFKDRAERGVRQAARFWRKEDGSESEFGEFCLNQFIADSTRLRKTFERFEKNFESLFGHLAETARDLAEPMDLDIGPMLPVDYLFAEYAPAAHVTDDLFRTKIAFVALLNFPLRALEERLKMGPGWTREQWAETRLAETFSARVPSDVSQNLNRAYVKAGDYISNYNLFMHHLLDEKGERLFPTGLRLISHWGLRDELKAQYANPDGVLRQRMIETVMERIIRQEIPKAALNNPAVDWRPVSNTVSASPVKDAEGAGAGTPGPVAAGPEPDTRYAMLLEIFDAERKADPFHPSQPTWIDRRFNEDREIPETVVEGLFNSILTSGEFGRTGRLVGKRLGRKLEPFDIWYNGFKARKGLPEAELDKMVSRRYPTAQAFQKDVPRILRALDFAPETADFLASKIAVDPARGVGHASEAGRRADRAHLRTRVPASGMNYKGYNIAVHELGHNVEQVLSLNRIDHVLLRGVPNTAFTEAFAFLFQNRDGDLLGMTSGDAQEDDMEALDALWAVGEIAGVSLVDMRVWRWMYGHLGASPAELKAAVVEISKSVWNEFFAPVFGAKDVILLGIYSHMIDAGLYLPDYPLGHIIAFQIERYMKGRKIGEEMERMCRLGAITPDAWMKAAVGAPISARPLLDAAKTALDRIDEGRPK
jgi:hypothetical protein